MNDRDRARRALEIAGSLLDLSPRTRAVRIEEVCGGDTSLRAEVESILAAEAHVKGFLGSSPVARALSESSEALDESGLGPEPLAPGQKLGEFIVEERIGFGGMGVIYRARQPALDRSVALKVLSPCLAAVPSARVRFRREARAAARLRHDRIVSVHTVGEDGEVCYYAMDLIQGCSLDRMLEERGVPDFNATARWTADTAEALDHAHSLGVVHRDVKPSNLILGDDGFIRITDFGLTRLREEPSVTLSGQVLGTPLYMSPEQLTAGAAVDGRSDVYSLGATLYQLLTSRPPFCGESAQRVMAKILQEDPVPPRRIDRKIPPDLETICLKALAKSPHERFATAGEFALDLRRFLDGVPIRARRAGTLGRCVKLMRRRKAATSLIAAALVLASAPGLLLWHRKPEPPAPNLAGAHPLTFDAGLTFECAISPDGRRIIYASDRSGRGDLDLYVHDLGNDGEFQPPIRITDDPHNDREPSLSSDGSLVAFRSDRDGGGIYVVPADGSAPARRMAPPGREPRISPDGLRIVYWTGDLFRGGRTYVVGLYGGEPVTIFPGADWTRSAVWSPDGARLLVFAQAGPETESDWWVVPLDGGPPRPTGVARAFPELQERSENHTRFSRWLDDGHVWYWSLNLYEARTELWAVPIAPGTGEIVGDAIRTPDAPGWFVHPSIADDRRIAFVRAEPTLDLWSVALDSNRGVLRGGSGLQRLTEHPAIEHRLSLSADGLRVAFGRVGYNGEEVWMKDLASGAERRIDVDCSWPAVSGDGSQIAYLKREGSLCVHDLESARSREIGRNRVPRSWSPDRRGLFVTSPDGIGFLSLEKGSEGEETEVLRRGSRGIFDPRPSPKGGWILFSVEVSPESSRIFVAPYRAGEATPESRWVALTDGSSWDDRPAWSPDGRLVYFASNRDGFFCIWARNFDPESGCATGDGPFEVLPLHEARFEFESYGGCWAYGVGKDNLVLTPLWAKANVWLTRIKAGDRG